MTRRDGAAVKMRYSANSGPLRKYHASTTERTIGCFAGKHGSLLIVGDGDLPQSHVSIATQFEQTACVDISKAALDISEKSCRKRGRFSDQLRPPRGKEFAVRLHLRCPRHLSYRRADAGEGRPRDDPAGEAGRSHRDPLQQSEVTDQIRRGRAPPLAEDVHP